MEEMPPISRRGFLAAVTAPIIAGAVFGGPAPVVLDVPVIESDQWAMGRAAGVYCHRWVARMEAVCSRAPGRQVRGRQDGGCMQQGTGPASPGSPGWRLYTCRATGRKVLGMDNAGHIELAYKGPGIRGYRIIGHKIESHQ